MRNYKPRNTSFDKSTPSRATLAKNYNIMLQNQLNYVAREKSAKGERERGKGVRGKTRLGEGEMPIFVGFCSSPSPMRVFPRFYPCGSTFYSYRQFVGAKDSLRRAIAYRPPTRCRLMARCARIAQNAYRHSVGNGSLRSLAPIALSGCCA